MRAVLSIALFFMCVSAVAAPGNRGPRAGQVEYSAAAVHSFSDSFQGLSGSSLDLASRTGLQFGIDYFVSSKLSVGFDVTWVRPRFDATLVPDDGSPSVDISHRSTMFTGQFNGTYNFLESFITPYVEGGLGWTYFDSNISDSAPITGCWWDPWWGYICVADWKTYEISQFTYNLGAGVRWDINNMLFTKASYVREFISAENGSINLDTAVVELGLMF